MTTLQQLVERDLGMSEKTAAANANVSGEDDSLQKLAASIGLDLSFGEEKVAEEETKEEEKKEETKEEEKEEEKTSSVDLGLGGLFSSFFPEDELGSIKVASEDDDLATYQEYLGGKSFEKFASRWDKRIEKIAVDMSTGSVHEDSQPPQTLENNKAPGSEQAIDTTPQVTDEVKKLDDQRTVGDYEKVQHSQMKTAAAMRKAALLAQLEG